MNEIQRHNFRLILSRVRGMSKDERHDYLASIKFGPIGVIVMSIARFQPEAK